MAADGWQPAQLRPRGAAVRALPGEDIVGVLPSGLLLQPVHYHAAGWRDEDGRKVRPVDEEIRTRRDRDWRRPLAVFPHGESERDRGIAVSLQPGEVDSTCSVDGEVG